MLAASQKEGSPECRLISIFKKLTIKRVIDLAELNQALKCNLLDLGLLILSVLEQLPCHERVNILRLEVVPHVLKRVPQSLERKNS
jgi:hypothetical protein